MTETPRFYFENLTNAIYVLYTIADGLGSTHTDEQMFEQMKQVGYFTTKLRERGAADDEIAKAVTDAPQIDGSIATVTFDGRIHIDLAF